MTKGIKNRQLNVNLKPILAVLIGVSIATVVYLVSKLPERAPPLKKTSKDSLYLYGAENKTFSANFGNKETKTPQVEFSVKGEKDVKTTATFTMLGTNVDTTNPVKKGNEIIFENIQENMDLRYETLPNGIKEEIVIRSNPAKEGFDLVNTFQFTLDIEDAYPQEITKGFPTPTFYDAQGNYLFHFEKPFAYDAKGARTDNAHLQVTYKGRTPAKGSNPKEEYRLILTVDKEWLTSEDRVYPIYIDPTIVHDTASEIVDSGFIRFWGTTAGYKKNKTDKLSHIVET